VTSPRARLRTLLLLGVLTWAIVVAPASAQSVSVATTTVSGPITPVTADHLSDVIDLAFERGDVALVVRLDTPGGLVSSMRVIVQEFLGAPLPIIVHVAPAGADAGSAGTFITMAAHVAAMAPATTIGAATPVDLEGGEVGDKVVNNAAAYAEAIATERGRDVEFAIAAVRDGESITADEALERNVVDLIAADLDELLTAIDGREIELVGGRTVTLETAGAAIDELEPSLARRILAALADPNVAFILLSLATLAILYEIANPGVGAGGVTGAVALILGLYALSALPTSLAGVALLVVAGILFAIEVVVPGIGVAAAGGTIALFLGGLFLFPRPTGIGVNLWVLLPSVLVAAATAVVIGVAAARLRDLPKTTVSDTLVGRHAEIFGVPDHPRVRIDGTVWRVVPADGQELQDGMAVTVVDRDNIDLLVVPDGDADKEA
jgi:membrane-bound serine protease (ClpP class)